MENFQLLLTDFHYSINAMKSKLIMNQDKDNYNKKYYIFENNLITFLMSADIQRRKFGTRRTFSRI